MSAGPVGNAPEVARKCGGLPMIDVSACHVCLCLYTLHKLKESQLGMVVTFKHSDLPTFNRL